jgi:hypothetical protein
MSGSEQRTLDDVQHADAQREEAEEEPQRTFREPGLKSCAEVAADQPAEPAGDPHRPVRSDVARGDEGEDDKREGSVIDVTKVDASAAGATTTSVMPEPTKIGLRIDPPPMPYTPPTIPTPNARTTTAGTDS